MIDYTELKRLAEQSKDSWVNGKWHTRPTLDIGVDEDDSAYIAAASPDVVLNLIKSLHHTTMAAEAEAKEVDERNAVIDRLRTQNQALREAVTAVIEYDEINPHDGMGMMFAYADALAKCRATQAEGGV